MPINRVIVKNYRTLKSADVTFGDGFNIIVGDNESGKSTLLEAINLALRRQINRRQADYELHPHLLNKDAVADFVAAHRAGKPIPPPEVLIELYFKDTPEVAILRGSANSQKADAIGISLKIRLSENLKTEYEAYVAKPGDIQSVPVEYYEIVWMSFANELLSPQSIPLKSVLIDPSNISNSYAANRYILDAVRDYLTKSQAVDLALAYRNMRGQFQGDGRIEAINADLRSKKGIVSEKILSVGMDTTTRANWETAVLPHLDDIPLTLVGKGEQNSVKIKLAIESAESCGLLLIEEPENHLSHTNLGKLVNHLVNRCADKQLIVSTHSSFVLNKLGIDHTIMFNGIKGVTLSDLSEETKSYFQRLPGHDTLRMILAKRSILVEGPSDELIVQKGFKQRYGKLPLEDGVEVISVGTSFKRFLDIAKLLNLNVAMARDNDGEPARKKEALREYVESPSIRICIDDDSSARTLEPQLLKSNGLEKLTNMIGIKFDTDESLLAYMTSNKTECALTLFEHADAITLPKYLSDAIE